MHTFALLVFEDNIVVLFDISGHTGGIRYHVGSVRPKNQDNHSMFYITGRYV